MKEFDDYKLNHRYPNNDYQTISKKYGRKVSKLGYPYIMKLNDQTQMLLCLKVGIKGQCINSIFPVLTKMTKDKPVCGLTLHYNFDMNEIRFISYEETEDGGWWQHNWYNYEIEEERKGYGNTIMKAPHRIDENSYTLIYEDIIEPCPSTLSELLLLP